MTDKAASDTTRPNQNCWGTRPDRHRRNSNPREAELKTDKEDFGTTRPNQNCWGTRPYLRRMIPYQKEEVWWREEVELYSNQREAAPDSRPGGVAVEYRYPVPPSPSPRLIPRLLALRHNQ